MIKLNDEVMREAKKSLKEKGIKSKDVKNLPPIEELCKPIPHTSTIEVHSIQRFDNRDIPYSKPPEQCLDEFHNYIAKQDNFNKRVQNHLLESSRAIHKLHDMWREPPIMLECLLTISKWFRLKLITLLRCKKIC
jgi:hypothetical protein